MVSLLENFVADQVAKGFKGRLSKCRLRVMTTTALDTSGDVVPGTAVEYPFDGIRENLNLVWAAQAGFPEADARVLFITRSLPASIRPKQGDLVFVGAPFCKWYRLIKLIEEDPAAASSRWAAATTQAP